MPLSLFLSHSNVSVGRELKYVLYSIQEKAVNISYSFNDTHSHYAMDAIYTCNNSTIYITCSLTQTDTLKQGQVNTRKNLKM